MARMLYNYTTAANMSSSEFDGMEGKVTITPAAARGRSNHGLTLSCTSFASLLEQRGKRLCTTSTNRSTGGRQRRRCVQLFFHSIKLSTLSSTNNTLPLPLSADVSWSIADNRSPSSVTVFNSTE